MSAAVEVFKALRSFDRPASRAEIERESGLEYDQVHEALRTLARHGLLVKLVDAPRRRGLYQLSEDARKPETARGRYERTEMHRQQIAALVRARRAGHAPPSYSPAAPPSHSAAPGALRTVVKGILDTRHESPSSFSVCTLETFWKRRAR